MEDLGRLFAAVLKIFQQELTLWGFTFSWWQVFVFVCVAGIIGWIISEVFLGD